MLLQFVVTNYRSFFGEEVLSMVPAKSRIHADHVLRPKEQSGKLRALPLAVLYGANASGKSNLIRAMSTARKIIVTGTRSGERIGVVPFKLAPGSANEATRFEFVVQHENVLYTYGFAVTQEEVKEEWLFAVFAKREVRLFERVTESGKVNVEFGSHLFTTKEEKQRLRFVAAGTRPNQLFLTEGDERNVEPFKPVMEWFRHHLQFISPDARYQRLMLRAQTDEEFTAFLGRFLSAADTGIEGIVIEQEPLDGGRRFAGLPDDLKRELQSELAKAPDHMLVIGQGKSMYTLKQSGDEPPQLLSLQTRHRKSDGAEVLFDARAESDGTHRMMHLAPALLELENSETVYVIDELDRSLHPHLCRMFLNAFLCGVTERGLRGQMIVTTHETGLLDLDLLRRDEIWFVEKDTQGASHLASLAEYVVRADLKVDKGYLNGRFGAIPFVGDTRKLFPAGGRK